VRRRVATLLLALVASCKDRGTIAPDPSERKMVTPPKPPDDAVDVWSKVIDDRLAGLQKSGVTEVLVIDRTIVAPTCVADLSTSMPTASVGALADWTTRRTQEAPIVGPLHASIRTTFVSPERASEMTHGDAGSALATGAGLVGLSSVAFDSAHGEAIVFLGQIRAQGDRVGWIVHLVKRGPAWTAQEIVACK
jgi:hypothetical protein